MLVFETAPRDTVLVKVHDIVPNIRTDVRYATTNNFTKQVLYPNDTLWLRKAAAVQLAKAQQLCLDRGLELKLFDAYRPLSIQRIMWQIVPDERYVANPQKGSRHNRGCAVDLTLCTLGGEELDMGTGYDEFTEAASATYTNLKPEVLSNRRLLLDIMKQAGFTVMPTEWWHYDMDGWENFAVLNE